MKSLAKNLAYTFLIPAKIAAIGLTITAIGTVVYLSYLQNKIDDNKQ